MVGSKSYLHRSSYCIGAIAAGRCREAVESRTPMKVACSSSALHRTFESGDLTQLEFVDLCARRWLCDGIVLDVRHFPRTDSDYLAQIKKMAADCGLGVAALHDADFFGRSSAESMEDSLRCAVATGAPLLSGRLARDTDSSWSEQLDRLSTASSLAKSANVTLAVRNAPGTFAATSQEFKRVLKETDSAWLRLAPEPQAFDRTSDPESAKSQTVLLWSSVGAQTEGSVDDIVTTFATFCGHICLDELSGDARPDDIDAAVRAWKMALAAKELSRS
jgi:sugar phosphate isomerase/epimerase